MSVCKLPETERPVFRFRVEEQNMCKTCGKPALTENCGNHYNNRAAGSTASVTKYNVVYATWIDRD